MKATIQAFILSAFCLTASAQTTAKEWQAKAVEKYPELSVQGSTVNKRFVEAYTERRKTNLNFFANPKWPLTLADELAERDQAEALVKLQKDRQAKIAEEAAAADAAAAAALDKAAAKAEAEQAEKEKAAQEAAWKSTQIAAAQAEKEKAAQLAAWKSTQIAAAQAREDAADRAAARSNNWWEVIGWAFGVLIVLLIIYLVIKLLNWIGGSLERGDRANAALIERALAQKPKHTEAPQKYSAVDLAADTAVGAAKFTVKAAVLFVPFAFRTAGKILGRVFKDDGKNR